MSLGVQFVSGTFLGLDSDDLPVSYGKVYFQNTQTGESITTYKNSGLTIINESPVVLNASGKAEIFLAANHYNIILTDQNDEVIWSINDYVTVGLGADTGNWREDQIAAVDQVDFILSSAVDSGTLVYKEGLLLTNGVDYIIIPNFTVQLTVAAADGDNLSFFGDAPAVTTSGLTSDGNTPMDPSYIPSVEQDIATKLYVDQHIPTAGTALDFYGVVAPRGFLPCDGQEVPKATYPDLYLVIGDTFATTGGVAAPEAANFRVPPQQIDGLGLYNRGKGPSLSVGTYQEDVFKNHNHLMQSTNTNHTHDINHDHAAFWTGSDGTHSHTYTDNIVEAGTINAIAFGNNYTNSGQSRTTTGTGVHKHSINVPALGTKQSGTMSEDTSHSHTIWSAGDVTETRPRSITVLKCISVGRYDWVD